MLKNKSSKRKTSPCTGGLTLASDETLAMLHNESIKAERRSREILRELREKTNIQKETNCNPQNPTREIITLSLTIIGCTLALIIGLLLLY